MGETLGFMLGAWVLWTGQAYHAVYFPKRRAPRRPRAVSPPGYVMVQTRCPGC